MLRLIAEFLPLCVVRILARRLEPRWQGNRMFYVPRPGVMIEVEATPTTNQESQYALGIGA